MERQNSRRRRDWLIGLIGWLKCDWLVVWLVDWLDKCEICFTGYIQISCDALLSSSWKCEICFTGYIQNIDWLVELGTSKTSIDWLIDWANAKYASLGTSKSIAMRYYHHQNAKYASLGTSKTLKDAGHTSPLASPRAKDDVSMERQNKGKQ